MALSLIEIFADHADQEDIGDVGQDDGEQGSVLV